MVRELVEAVLVRLQRFFLYLFTALRSSSRAASQSRSTRRRSDTLLQNAALLSLSIHMIALLLLPTPGSSEEVPPPNRITLNSKLVQLEPEPVPEPLNEKEAPSEPEIDEAPDEPPIPDETDEIIAAEPPPPEPLPTPVVEQAAEETTDTAVEKSLEQQKIDRLLEETRKSSRQNQARDRWLMLEVREKVLNNLSRLLKGGASIHQGKGKASFLLGFRIDAEGWIYDLTLRPAPGVQLDAFAIRDAVAILNPLTPPPAGGKFPIDLRLKVDFLDQRK